MENTLHNQAYRERIQFLAKKGGKVLNNNSEHGQIFLEESLRIARDSLLIVSETLYDKVYDDPTVLFLLEKALDRGVKIQVLVTGEITAKEFPRLLLNKGGILRKIEIPYSSNFTVTDIGVLSRFEKNQSKHEAVIYAKDKTIGTKLAKIFIALKKKYSNAISLAY